MMAVTIRKYRSGDETDIWRLNTQELGYPFSFEEMAAKLVKLAQNPEHCILVAQWEETVVGYIHGNDYEVLYMPAYKNILGLAVANDYQHRGIGKALLQGIEDWAKATGAAGIRLVSGEERTGAHAFYEACGYQRKKKQVNFRKDW